MGEEVTVGFVDGCYGAPSCRCKKPKPKAAGWSVLSQPAALQDAPNFFASGVRLRGEKKERPTNASSAYADDGLDELACLLAFFAGWISHFRPFVPLSSISLLALAAGDTEPAPV